MALQHPHSHHSQPQRRHYPKPGKTGGRLIRQVIGFLRESGLELPLTGAQAYGASQAAQGPTKQSAKSASKSAAKVAPNAQRVAVSSAIKGAIKTPTKDSHILCAVSGGSDSIALAHLLIKYGRKVVSPKKIILVHVNHGWRGKDSDDDARFVRAFARQHGVKAVVYKVRQPRVPEGESWENAARRQRKRIFKKAMAKYGASFVLTAHQADDLAETLLWRIFTGAAQTHGGGIRAIEQHEVRPMLPFRKWELKEFLKEEEQAWREDVTNEQGRFLRSQMRLELMPTIERLFPRAVAHLVDLAIAVQRAETPLPAEFETPEQAGEPAWTESPVLTMAPATAEAANRAAARASARESDRVVTQAVETLLGQLGIRSRRAHYEFIQKHQSPQGAKSGEVHLPQGWRLRSEKIGKGARAQSRWVLEKTPETGSPGPK